MTSAVQLVHDGFAVVLAIAAAMLVAALVGVLVAAVIARAVGLQDPATSTVARALAMLVALAVLGAAWAEQVRSFAASSWATLGAGTPPLP